MLLLLLGSCVTIAHARPYRLAITSAPQTLDCAAYCDGMARTCPDVFLGNRATCLATCALFPADADPVALGCRIPGQTDATAVPQQPVGPTADEATAATARAERIRAQLEEDTTVIPAGLGAIFIPSLGLNGRRRPVISVWTARRVSAEGRPGRRIVLPPGEHLVRFGDAPDRMQIRAPVTVVAGQTSVVDAPWGALQIDVVDPQFVPFRGSYELIDFKTREVVGLGFGADALLGERLRVWVLRPGVYKIVQPGGNYRDRTNFATVRLLPGEITRYVLVQDPDTAEFKGAGLVNNALFGDDTWILRGLIGGDFTFLRSELASTERGWSLALNLFFDVSARMTIGQHRWLSRLELEEGQTRPPGTDRFRSLRDRLFLHTIYTYALVQWFGPYVRAGMETKVLPRTEEFDSPRNVEREDGTVLTNVERVDLATDFFSPIELIQGMGGNVQVFRSRTIELDLRLGLGARQVVPRSAHVLLSGDGAARLVPLAPEQVEGVESSAIGSARLGRWVTLSTEFDSLFAFDEGRDFIFTWRNQINLRLASFASMAYRFNALRNEVLTLESGIQTEHTFQIRFSYPLF